MISILLPRQNRGALARTLIVCAIMAPFLVGACATRAAAFDVQVGAGSPYAGLKVDGSAIDVTLTNTGRRKAKRVSLPCEFFDQDGETVMSGMVYFNDLRAGARSTNRVILATPGVVRGACLPR